MMEAQSLVHCAVDMMLAGVTGTVAQKSVEPVGRWENPKEIHGAARRQLLKDR